MKTNDCLDDIAAAWKLLETALSWEGVQDKRLNVFLSELTAQGFLLDYAPIVARRITNAYRKAIDVTEES
jgi:hypothetical protein